MLKELFKLNSKKTKSNKCTQANPQQLLLLLLNARMDNSSKGCIWWHIQQLMEETEINRGTAVLRVLEDAALEALVPLKLVAGVGVPGLHVASSGGIHALHDHDNLDLAVTHVPLHHMSLLTLPAVVHAVCRPHSSSCRGVVMVVMVVASIYSRTSHLEPGCSTGLWSLSLW